MDEEAIKKLIMGPSLEANLKMMHEFATLKPRDILNDLVKDPVALEKFQFQCLAFGHFCHDAAECGEGEEQRAHALKMSEDFADIAVNAGRLIHTFRAADEITRGN